LSNASVAMDFRNYRKFISTFDLNRYILNCKRHLCQDIGSLLYRRVNISSQVTIGWKKFRGASLTWLYLNRETIWAVDKARVRVSLLPLFKRPVRARTTLLVQHTEPACHNAR